MARLLVSVGALVVALFLGGSVAGIPAGGSMGLVFERTWENGSADAMGIGPDGSVYVAGLTVVGEYPFLNTDATLLKWSADGQFLWARSWQGINDEEARGVAVDAYGDVYVTGISNSFGYFDAFLLKFDSSGNLKWQRIWGGAAEEGGEAVAVGADGGIYVAGSTQSFGEFLGAVTFLLKFASDGTLVWQRTWETVDGGLPRDIAAAPDGSIYVGGLAYPRGYVAKFSAAGDLLWDRTYLAPAATGFTEFEGLGVAPDGGVVAVGQFQPTFDQQVLIVRFSASGAVLDARSWGGDGSDVAVDAVVAADGTTYVVGETDTFTAGIFGDFFIMKLLPGGRAREVRTWGGSRLDTPGATALGPSGDLYAAGRAGLPPYQFQKVSSRVFQVRDGRLTDPIGLVGTPAGTLVTPDGAVAVLEVTVPAQFGGGALIRVRPT